MKCCVYLLSDGERAGALQQAEHTAGAEHHGAAAEAQGHRQGDAPGATAGMSAVLHHAICSFFLLPGIGMSSKKNCQKRTIGGLNFSSFVWLGEMGEVQSGEGSVHFKELVKQIDDLFRKGGGEEWGGSFRGPVRWVYWARLKYFPIPMLCICLALSPNWMHIH